jgi:alkanesulfonate monooxygenase SsuD/methylene tetrahydromethanopterin reductase-like flavin-dependent oxidoreductase (luciferase family)
MLDGYLASQLIGGPETVCRRGAELIAATGADELMAISIVYEHAERIRSYEILAEAVGAVPDAVAG